MSDADVRGGVYAFIDSRDFENEFVNVLNTAAYANLPSPKREPKIMEVFGESTYENNEHFWTDIIQSGPTKSGKHISLKEFHLTEWIPRSPGTYFLPESRDIRQQVNRFYNSDLHEYVPEGKGAMVLAGVGSLRIDYKPIENKKYAFLGATSDGITHEGFPVAVRNDKYQELIDKIRESGGCICNISGTLEVLPKPFALQSVEYNRGVPKFYLLADKIDFRNYSEKNSLKTSVAITFSRGEMEGYGSKSWSFCSFNSAKKEDLDRAVDWLCSYARRYSQVDNPNILSDFDEYYEHFPADRIEFPTSELAQGKVNMEKVDRYRASGVPVVIEDRSIHIYGSVTNSPMYSGDFKDTVNTTYSDTTTVNPHDTEE